jgi:catechol 2,3-dioxygenase-like lactoylglutathione lyase family enzyme
MLNINGIDHLNLFVKNLENSKQFYKDLFGFEIHESGISAKGYPYAIIGKSQKAFLAIYENPSALIKQSHINHIGFNVSNFQDAKEAIKELGVKEAIWGEVDYGKSKSLYILDPDENEIEISSHFGGGF